MKSSRDDFRLRVLSSYAVDEVIPGSQVLGIKRCVELNFWAASVPLNSTLLLGVEIRLAVNDAAHGHAVVIVERVSHRNLIGWQLRQREFRRKHLGNR